MPSVTFVLTLNDHDALTERILRKRAGWAYTFVRWIYPGLICLGVATNLVLLWNSRSLVPANGNWFGTYGNIVLWLIIGLSSPFQRFLRRVRIRKSSSFGQPVQITLEQEGIRENTMGVQAMLPWSQTLRIEETSKHLFLFIQENRAFIVPLRSFATTDEARTFIGFAHNRWSEAHPSSQAPPIALPT